MIPKAIHEIDHIVLQALVEDQVAEGKTIEYKREMPAKGDSEAVPFLASISSFANTSGGDFLIGVEAKDGLPRALPGVELASPDQEKLRLEHLMANGLEPRLPRVDVRPIKVAEDRYVLVVRAPRSWVAPHRVAKNHKFYGRNSAGRYELDVGELRTAFTLSETVAERIRNFRVDRIARIYGRETPVSLRDGGCMILHLLPLAAFTEQPSLDLSEYTWGVKSLTPMGASGWNTRINLDGVVTFNADPDEPSPTYTQLFRSGVVEAVEILYEKERGMSLSPTYERTLARALRQYSKAVADLGVEPPLYVFLSFVGVRGCRLARQPHEHPDEVVPLRDDSLLPPEIVIEQKDFEPHSALLPLFEMVWNAFGMERALH